jgi:hypothetical protein
MNDQDTAQRGVLAAAARAELHRRVEDRVDRILTSLINRHRDPKGGISGDDAKAGIAAISEMRLLLATVESDIRQGELARDRLMAPSP